MDGQRNRRPWVVGELPRRSSTRRQPPARPAENGVLAERAQRARNQALVGRPLTAVLRGTANAQQPSPRMILLSITGVALLVVAAFSSSPLLIGGGGLLALLTALALWRQQQSRATLPLVELSGQLPHDAAQLDDYLLKISGKLPAAALKSVAQIKETLRQLLSLLPSADDSRIELPGEDLFFINQLVSRYLPDTCRHYLDARRGAIDARSETAETLEDSLNRQLAILHERLRKSLKAISEQHAQALSRHEAFLDSKRNRD